MKEDNEIGSKIQDSGTNVSSTQSPGTSTATPAPMTSRERKRARKQADAQRKKIQRLQESEEEKLQRLAYDTQRSAARRLEESQRDTESRRKRDASRILSSRNQLSEEAQQERRVADVRRTAKRRSEEPRDVQQKRREQNAAQTAEARSGETQEETETRRKADRTRKASRKTAQFGIAATDSAVDIHYAGRMEEQCVHCGALFFKDELTTTDKFSKCCLQGTVKQQLFDDFPLELKDLFTTSDPEAVHFRENCRQYNNSLAMGSIKAKIDVPPGRGPYCYRLHGQIYHLLGPLHPAQGEPRQFAQVFIMDTGQAAEELAGRQMNANCREQLFARLLEMLKRENRFVKSFKTMYEVEQEEERAAIRENRPERRVKMTFRTNSDDDHRRY